MNRRMCGCGMNDRGCAGCKADDQRMEVMWFGWKRLPIGQDGLPSETKTGWVASCFILFTHVVYIGEVRKDESI
ncbi:MAG: hypothetical protein JAY90_20120 [Candidatus Thiodiazotropha lotti]|nr:hypothetical protein [Candidatus Thiodiazotropha lotti]